MKLLIGICALLWCQSAFAKVPEVFIKTVAMESASQSSFGKFLVARVILNRARIKGKTVEAVCLAPYQFSCNNTDSKTRAWRKAWLDRHYTPKVRQECLESINKAIVASGYNRITHYHTLSVRPFWAKGKTASITEGKHKFYEGIK